MKNNELKSKGSPIKAISKVASAIAIALVATASQAEEFETDNFEISFDSTFTLGASWRVEERDARLIGKANLYNIRTGGDISALWGSDPAAEDFPEGAWSNNSDDGNLNFDKGDMFSNVMKGVHELDIRHKDGEWGYFGRGLWYYDRVLMDKELRFRNLDSYPEGGYATGAKTARKEQGYDARLLDSYLWMNFDVGEASTLQMRLGEQVISWGESTFIQHSLSEANAVDLRTLRNPGAELKEALIPSGMLWSSLDLTESITAEVFYQYEWEPVRVDEPGTYFSTRDFLGNMGEIVQFQFGQVSEGTPFIFARRSDDRPADDQGQYGFKLGYFTEGGTEFAFYHMNYHNRRPIISAISANANGAVTGFLEYPEDIKMYGLSFNTATDSGWSIAGEVSYRQDEPFQVDDVELLFATLEPVGRVPSGTSQVANGVGLGEEISGYRLLDNVQAQMTLLNLFGPTMGSNQTTFIFELGANQILDMPSQDELRFETEGTFRSGNPLRAGGGAFLSTDPLFPVCNYTDPQGVEHAAQCEGVETNSFADEFSWGYRMAMRWDYNDVFWGFNMSPRIVFQHDVNGNTPAPIGNFLEGRKSLSIGTSFDYQSTWKIDFAYNRFFGAGTANLISDRDYVSLAFSYSL